MRERLSFLRAKKIFSFVLGLLMVLTLIPMMPMEVRAATSSANLTTGIDQSEIGWVWDNSNKTLTMNGATFSSNGSAAAIKLPADSTIVVSGDNTVSLGIVNQHGIY